TLAVYNSLGQKVAQLSSGYLSAGEHKVVWDASDKASGVYYVMLKSNGHRVVRKALLMK
ncbi:MAG TPA: T9SS type A sorting domain-containing protein, partial [Caldithrix sp.]|nr:T9SS type A sorting domain-containing protein [Caldithrix sp.]